MPDTANRKETSFLGAWLRDEDVRLAESLERHAFVIEANWDEGEIRRAQRFYGQGAGTLLRMGRTPDDIITRYPALTLAILVGQASLGYDQGKYWESFWRELGIESSQKFENALRRHMVRLLRRYSLLTVRELSTQYVQLAAFHAGIPVNCLPPLVRSIEQHLAAGRERSGGAVVAWLLSPDATSRAGDLDVPVRNFIRYGGEFALNIITQIVEVVGFVIDHPDDWDDVPLDTSTTGLPTILVDGLVEELRTSPIGSARQRSRSAARRRPHIAYSVELNQIVLELPYPSRDSDQPWRISLDGTTREVWPERAWGVAGTDQPPTPAMVERPSREAVVEHASADGVKTSVSIVDPRDPILIFDRTGRRIADGAALSPDEAYVVFPEGATLVDPAAQQVIPIDTADDLRGWNGWRVLWLDLSGYRAIRLLRDNKLPGVARSIRINRDPRLVLPEPVVGATTSHGLPVYAERPDVALPADPAGLAQDWRVRVRRVGVATEWITDEVWTGDAEETSLDPFDGLETGIAGLFEVIVTGTQRRELRHTFFLVEGLTLDAEPALRIPDTGGLTPSTVRVDVPSPLTVDRPVVEFGPRDTSAIVQLSGGPVHERISVVPPAVELHLTEFGKPVSWRMTAPSVSVKDLDTSATIGVRVPVDADVTVVVRVGERTIHKAEPAGGDGVWQIATRQLVDAVREVGDCRIVAMIRTFDASLYTVNLVTVTTEQLCSSIVIDNGTLVFADLIEQDDLAVYVWPETAPWRDPFTVAVTGSTTPLPPELVNAGPLIVEPFIDDPWVVLPPPSAAGPDAWRVDQPGWMSDEQSGRETLSRFLAGEGAAPGRTTSIPEVWSALTALPVDSADTAQQRARSALTRILEQDPRTSLESLGNSLIPVADMAELLIRTGLVSRSYTADFTLNPLHNNPWVGCMVEIADLPSLFARRKTVQQERAETIAYLSDKGGVLLIDLLTAGTAEGIGEGLFDKGVEALDRLPESQVYELVTALELVPEALLDVDTRVAANVQAFRARDQWVVEGWSQQFGSAVLHVIERIGWTNRLLREALTIRNDALTGVDTTTDPWMLVSLQSLVLAVAARMSAHGMHVDIDNHVVEPWARMARLAPNLVLTDLLIAEALVTHTRHGDLIGDDR